MRSCLQNKPKTTKSCRVEGASGKQAGDADARPAPPRETKLNPTPAHRSSAWGLRRPPPDTSPEAGRACAFSTGPRTHAPRGARPTTRARAGLHAECRRDYSGTRRAGTNWKPGGGKDPSGPAASSERASPGKCACTLRAGRGRRVSPDEPRGHRKCAGREGYGVPKYGCGHPKAAGFLAGLRRLGFRARHADSGHARVAAVGGVGGGKKPPRAADMTGT